MINKERGECHAFFYKMIFMIRKRTKDIKKKII